MQLAGFRLSVTVLVLWPRGKMNVDKPKFWDGQKSAAPDFAHLIPLRLVDGSTKEAGDKPL
jgi:hypothetical protein